MAYEIEVGVKENFIFICPCVDLEKNIKDLNENKSIYCIIGYCPIFNHDDNIDFFYKFTKFYGIVNSCEELIDNLFKLNNIFYYRKKQKYEIDNVNNGIIETKYERNVLIDLQNDNSKNHVINEKLDKYFEFKIKDDNYYFALIKSLTLLNKCLEDKNYNFLFSIIEKLGNIIILSDNELENKLYSSICLKNLHILYLYFLNYPYFYGKLTDEEIIQIISNFKSNKDKSELESNIISGFNALITLADALAYKIDKRLSILNENEKLKNLHRIIIEINFSIEQLKQGMQIGELCQYYQIKNYLRDIDFCLGKLFLNILINYCPNYPLKFEITHPYISKEKRLGYYILYSVHLKKLNENPNGESDEEKILNKSIKYNDTIVIGDNNFHNIIQKIKLPCKNIYYIKENEITKFFEKPPKINNKYKICKYFIITNEKFGIEFLETFKYITNVFGIKLVIIILVQNINIKIDKKFLQTPIMPTILTYNEKDILNYYCDNFDRLKEINIKSGDEDESIISQIKFDFQFPKLSETKIIKEQDNGWDMKRNIDINLFNMVNYERILGYINQDKFIREMYKVYQENNCLDLYLNYYGNYLGADYIVEQQCSLVALVKMFLYAYTLEEKNGKSFYSIMNNDFRSGDANKI